jgi:RNA polymerase sigma-32 factor
LRRTTKKVESSDKPDVEGEEEGVAEVEVSGDVADVVDAPVELDDDEEAEPHSPEPVAVSETALVRQDPLSRYLSEIRRYPLLSPEEEHKLAVDYREYGDLQAAYRLVTANLRLVVMIARRYEKAFRNLFDLVQEGNIGLYAVWWIRAYVIRYIMNNFRLVKVGTTQAQRRLFFNLKKEMDRLEAEGFDVNPELIAKRLEVKPSEVVEMQQRMGARDLSVNAPLGGEEDGGSMLDLLPSHEGTAEELVTEAHDQKWMAGKMREFGATLEGKDKTIFDERLLTEDPRTLQDIGEKYGISRERVRQIEERLKRRLKAFLQAEMKDVEEVEVMPRPREKRAPRRDRTAKR